MADITWIAAHSEAPLDRDRIDAWIAGVEAAFASRLEGFERVVRIGQHIGLIAWWDPAHAPSAWRQVESTAAGLALFDGMPIGFERTGAATASPDVLGELVSRDPARGDQLHPPWAAVRLAEDELQLIVDPLGFAAVYVAAQGGIHAWSSSPGIASLFTYGDARPSESGWAAFLVHGRQVGETSSHAGVDREHGRTVVRAADRPDGLRIERPDVVRPLLDGPTVAEPAAAVRTAIEPVFRSVRALDPRSITVPFSGGRDSRVLAAIGLTTGTVDRLWTSSPPELDVTIARDLLTRLERAVPWTTTDKSGSLRDREADAAAGGVEAFWDRALRHHGVTEGQAEITPHGTAPASSAAPDEVRLWGIGGEFARAFYYDAAALADPDGRTRAFWSGLARIHRLVDPDAQTQLVVPRLEATRASYEDGGAAGLRQLDLFYVLERVRRLRNRIPTAGRVWPYFALDYVRFGLALSAAARVHDRTYEDVVAAAVPRWAGQPYAHELRSANLEAATAASQAEAFWGSRHTGLVVDDLRALVRVDPLLVPDEFERLVAPRVADRWAVRRMRRLNQVITYLTFRRHLESIVRSFSEAGGRAAVGEERLPDVAIGRSGPRSAPADLGARAILGRLRPLGRVLPRR